MGNIFGKYFEYWLQNHKSDRIHINIDRALKDILFRVLESLNEGGEGFGHVECMKPIMCS